MKKGEIDKIKMNKGFNLKIDRNKTLFLIYFYLLIFTIINKAFVPFGIDLRFIVVALGFFQIILNFHGTKLILTFDKNMKMVFFLYALIVMGIFSVSFDIPNKDIFNNLVILNIYNLFNIVILAITHSRINTKNTIGAMRFSIVVLAGSIVMSILEIPLPFNDYQSVSTTGSLISVARYCGYGTDPNYVSLMFVTYALIICAYSLKSSNKIVQIVISAVFLLLSQSLTVIAMLPVILLIYFILKRVNEKNRKFTLLLIFVSLAIIPLAMQRFRPLDNNISLSLRYNMWSRALNAFFEHPIIGNGLGAARFLSFYTSNWLVQCHSTYFQLLCEHGIIALFLYFRIFYLNTVSTKNNLKSIIYLLYFVWSFTYETMYLPFTILYFSIFPYCLLDESERRN